MKTIDKIGYKVILFVLLLLNIFIGSNIKRPIWIVQGVVSIFSTIYIITKKIQKEKNIVIKGKIDIAVLCLMVSTIIPLIVHNYVSLEGTINFILKYWSVYALYILTRNIVKEEKQINGIKIALIISSIIPIIIGYDMLTKNVLNSILEKIDAVQIEDTRMVSIFGYANTFAAYLGLTTSLAIGQFIKATKKKKVLYGIYILTATVTILLTQSKMVLALIAFIILLFIIKGIKDKKIGKKWIISGSIIIILFLMYVFIAKDIGKPLEITSEKNCVIRNLEKNTKYDFEFDIKAETDKEENSFEIEIVEITRYLSENKLTKFELGKFEGTKKIELNTTENLDHIEIRIKNKYGKKITINKLEINGKNYILEYKYILEPIVRIFTTFNFKNSSVWQRGDFWRDSIKIIKNKWLFGGGGNTWRYSYGRVQDYLYYAKECHSYILEIIMSFGILGILSYIFIIAISIKNGVNQKSKILSILVGISIIALHSLMDFDMSYLIMEMIFYMFIAIINNDDNTVKFNINWIDIPILIIIMVVSIGNVLGVIGQVIKDNTYEIKSKIVPWDIEYQYQKIIYKYEHNNLNEETIKSIEKFVDNEPYCHQRVMYSIILECDLTEDDVEFFINIWKNTESQRPYNITDVRKVSDARLNIAKKTSNKELRNEILQIIIDEYPKYAEIFLENVKNKKTRFMSKCEYEYYTENYEEAINIINNEDTS